LVVLNINPNNDLVSYGIDTTGRRQYTLHIKDLKTNTIFKDEISNTTGGSTWANDNKTLFYTLKDETTLRSEAIYKHRLNSEQKSDELIYEETDDTFGVSVYKPNQKNM
jgi:oligopeptidase B